MAEPLLIPADAAQRLLAAANGDAALLYLYLFENRPLSGAQTALRMTQARYDLACATLQQLGLWPQEARTHLDASQAPVYTEQDVIRETRTSREFEAITGETQRRLGRVLSNEELKSCCRSTAIWGFPARSFRSSSTTASSGSVRAAFRGCRRCGQSKRKRITGPTTASTRWSRRRSICRTSFCGSRSWARSGSCSALRAAG